MRHWILIVGLILGAVWAQEYSGSYTTEHALGMLRLELVQTGAELRGTLSGAGIHFELKGFVFAEGAGGAVYTAEGMGGFEIYLQGDTLGLYLFELDEDYEPIMDSVTELIMTRRGSAASPPGAQTANPLGQAEAPANPLATGANDPVMVQGQYASLTRDNALAFIEAFEFALIQVGYAYRFTDAEREQLLQAVVQAFPQAEQMDQVVLSHAREIWTRVQANWPRASEAERREFILGVFILAFGEEAVQQWVGPTGSGGQGQALGTDSCGSFEDCTSRFVDQRTWSDTFNAQGCWAAAGCNSYDSSSGTFSYADDW